MFSGQSWWLKVMGVEAYFNNGTPAGRGVTAPTFRISSFPWMTATVRSACWNGGALPSRYPSVAGGSP